MEQNEWNSVKYKVNDMISADSQIGAIPADVIALAGMLLQTGDNNESTRESLTISIRGMLKPYPGYPWKRGNQGSLPAAARAIVDVATSEISYAAVIFFETTQQYAQPLLRKHGKSKGSPVYADAEEYASVLVKKVRQNAAALHKSGEWDGTLEGLTSCASYDVGGEEE
tara:strand:- start:25105 stop:25611 length:507 start_codon:yes stop_codon:yes gene_type:complete